MKPFFRLARLHPRSLSRAMMSSREDSIPHELRTAAEPRQNRRYPVHLSHVEQVNQSVRLLQLAINHNVCFFSMTWISMILRSTDFLDSRCLACFTSTLAASANELTPLQNDQQQQPLTFLPGQWLDVHIPSIAQAGGFTITSTPADAQALPSPMPRRTERRRPHPQNRRDGIPTWNWPSRTPPLIPPPHGSGDRRRKS